MSDEEHADFLVARFMFDEYGRPFPKRAERAREFIDAALALAKVKGSGSKEEARLVRKLASGWGRRRRRRRSRHLFLRFAAHVRWRRSCRGWLGQGRSQRTAACPLPERAKIQGLLRLTQRACADVLEGPDARWLRLGRAGYASPRIQVLFSQKRK